MVVCVFFSSAGGFDLGATEWFSASQAIMLSVITNTSLS
jgi:hypothetical protein